MKYTNNEIHYAGLAGGILGDPVISDNYHPLLNDAYCYEKCQFKLSMYFYTKAL